MKHIEVSNEIMGKFHKYLLTIGYRCIGYRQYRRTKGILQFKDDGAMNHQFSREFQHFLEKWFDQGKIFIERLS